MNNNLCFEKTKISLSKNHRIFSEHLSYDYDQVDVKQYERSRTFFRHNLPQDYFKGEPINDLITRYKLSAKIFLIEAEHQYNWHRDAFRMNSFNLLLTDDTDYLTIFAHTYPKDFNVDITKFTYQPITRLVYDPCTLYFLNAQTPHMAINYSKKNRYMLTLAHFSKEPMPTFSGGLADFTAYEATVKDLAEQGWIADASSNPNN